MRKRYTAQYKAGIVREILKEEKAIGQIASEQGIHPNQLNRWKAIALEGLPSLFSKDGKATDAYVTATEHERQLHELYAEIGRLTTQLTWLQKKSGIDTAKS